MKKADLVTLSTIPVGDVFTYAKQEFIALEHTESGTVAITADCVCEKAFDESDSEIRNDWKTSTLKKWLNEDFLEKLIKEGADLTAFRTMLFDLTADDGLNDYGTDESKVGLLSVDAYRKYRKLLKPIDDWWWLITPYSVASNDYPCYVRDVGTTGTLDLNNACYGDWGVRPLCTLQSETLVSVCK